ncbi:MAG: hypothetical protein J2P17_27085, partial [Mycobacterium sp.]|nr:hypothetical protein [Mycobacterium sp.]
MELRDYLRTLRRGWPMLLVFLVLGVGAGVLLTVTSTKIYQASAQLFVATSTSQSPTDLQNANNFVQAQVQSYTSIATSPKVTDPVVHNPVIHGLGLSLTGAELASKISADAPLNKVLINLHVTDHDPIRAARVTNVVAAQFARVVENTVKTDAHGKPVVKLTIIHPASVPSSPIKPNKILNIGLGFVIGLLVGIAIVVLRDVLDNSVKTSDFEELGVPVLGNVPFDKRAARTPIAFRGDLHSARSE